MKQFIKIVLAIILLGCLLKMPYGYYQFVRLIVCIGMLYLAYLEKGKPALVLGCIGIAILINPVIKVYFDRSTWNDIDIVVAIFLGIWVSYDFISSTMTTKDGESRWFIRQ